MTKTTPTPLVRALNLYTVEQDGKPVAQAMAISQSEAVRLYVESVQQPTMSARLSTPMEARTLAGLPLLQREPAAVDTRTADLFEGVPAADHVEDSRAMVEPLAAGGFAPTQAERMASAYAAGLEIARQGHTRWSAEFLDANAAALSGLRYAAADEVHAEMLRGFEDGQPIPCKHELKRQAEAHAARAGGKIVAKYRDPETGQTWTGRGLKPKWLLAAIEAGRTQDEFLIDPA